MWYAALLKKPGERPQSTAEVRERLAACRDIPRWRQADARQWWQAHGEALKSEPVDVSTLETRTLNG